MRRRPQTTARPPPAESAVSAAGSAWRFMNNIIPTTGATRRAASLARPEATYGWRSQTAMLSVGLPSRPLPCWRDVRVRPSGEISTVIVMTSTPSLLSTNS